MEIETLRYPIGKFIASHHYSSSEMKSAIQVISALPSKIINLTAGWEESKLNTPYRDGGWTVRQLIHHLADSHINAYTRTRLALTEENPVIKPYDEKAWAELPDGVSAPIDLSIQLLKYTHMRWVLLLNSLDSEQLQMTYFHPSHQVSVPLSEMIAQYAWHSEHHYQHMRTLAQRKGWLDA
jgi:hypothetical protein